MRVSPGNQYQLVGPDSNHPDIQLASEPKNPNPRRCISFVICGRPATGHDMSSPPLKVGPTQERDVSTDKVNDTNINGLDDDDSNETEVVLKSSSKMPLNSILFSSIEDGNEKDVVGEKGSDIPGHTERRKIQWKDDCGKELFEIREFDPSDVDASDDEYANRSKRCYCAIM